MKYRVCTRTLENGVEVRSVSSFANSLDEAKLEAMRRLMTLKPYDNITYVVDVCNYDFNNMHEYWKLIIK